MANKGKRQKFNLVCSECKTIGYVTMKSVVNTTDKLELKKYCKRCKQSTVHNEGKLPNPKPRN